MSEEDELLTYTLLLGFLGLIASFLLYKHLSAPAPKAKSAVAKPAPKPKAEPKGPPATVFYGSQTGTSEGMATKFVREMKRHGFNAKLVDMEEFEMDGMENLEEEPYVVFFLATHGEGDPTDNAKAFYEWLKDKERQEGELSKLAYSVFGLGNTQYEEYNAMGRYFDTRLAELGAQRIGEYGEGDDDKDIEADFDGWKEANIRTIKVHFLGEEAADIVAAPELEYRLVDVSEKAKANASTKGIRNTFLASSTRSIVDNQVWLPARLSAKRELQKGSDRSTLHLELEPVSSDFNFQAGDHIGVRAENNPKMVAAIASRLSLDLKEVISLKAMDCATTKAFRFPCPCTLLVALSAWLDINATPRQEVLQLIAEYASDPAERTELEMLGSADGKHAYQTTLHDPATNLIELLDRFKSLQIPLHALLELLPRLTTRYYSISNSLRLHKNQIHLTAAVVKYPNQTPGLAEREGIATTWFDRMRTGAELQLHMRTAGFHLPTDTTRPVIMVGPGTGLAPFRGFIHEWTAIRRSGAEVGPMVLFFGCRSKSQDYIYQEELEAAVEEGVISNLFTAFSRDQAEKVYVQHLMAQQAELVTDLLVKQGGSFYICGDAKHMATDVNNALLKGFQSAGGMSAQEAEEFVHQMKADKRYLTDVWA